VFALLVSSGCTSFHEYIANGYKVGPNYLKPGAAVKEHWIDAADRRVSSESVNMSHWWAVFNDPVLENLVNEAESQNLTLREAGFRILQARALRDFQAGNLFPQTQNMFGSYNRYEISKKNTNTAFIPQRFYSQHQVGFNLSWELDFWGRFRRAIEAADAELDASVEGYDAVLVTLQGDIATAYVQMRTIQRELVLVRANVKLQEETLQYTEQRAKAGLTSDLDLVQAQSNVAQTEALVPQFEGELRFTTNRLCVLLGIPPEQLTDKLSEAPIPVAPERVAVGIPAELLTRRPDIRRAERTAAAQCARIGVATADLYPHIAINGTIGSSAGFFPNLLKDQSFFGNVGPAFQWNILNYGRLKNNIRYQDARFQELVATYQQTVLQAAEEAENGLVRFLKAQERAQALDRSVKASQKAVDLAVTQYRGGLVDFNRVSLLQLNLVQQQDLLAQAQGSIALGLVDLYRALGGGWEHRLYSENEAYYVPEANPYQPNPADEGMPVPAPADEGAPPPPAPQEEKKAQSSRGLIEVPGRGLARLGDSE
jgi:NodT family efflux transporter outer membrane factor (OMF) lipoprotein